MFHAFIQTWKNYKRSKVLLCILVLNLGFSWCLGSKGRDKSYGKKAILVRGTKNRTNIFLWSPKTNPSLLQIFGIVSKTTPNKLFIHTGPRDTGTLLLQILPHFLHKTLNPKPNVGMLFPPLFLPSPERCELHRWNALFSLVSSESGVLWASSILPQIELVQGSSSQTHIYTACYYITSHSVR